MATPSRNVAELFDTLIPAGLVKFADQARAVNAIYAFRITGDGGGEWTCDLSANPPTCVRGASKSAQCTVECTAQDFGTLLVDPSAGMQLYFQGKLRVTGDPMLAMKLQELFKLAQA